MRLEGLNGVENLTESVGVLFRPRQIFTNESHHRLEILANRKIVQIVVEMKPRVIPLANQPSANYPSAVGTVGRRGSIHQLLPLPFRQSSARWETFECLLSDGRVRPNHKPCDRLRGQNHQQGVKGDASR